MCLTQTNPIPDPVTQPIKVLTYFYCPPSFQTSKHFIYPILYLINSSKIIVFCLPVGSHSYNKSSFPATSETLQVNTGKAAHTTAVLSEPSGLIGIQKNKLPPTGMFFVNMFFSLWLC